MVSFHIWNAFPKWSGGPGGFLSWNSWDYFIVFCGHVMLWSSLIDFFSSQGSRGKHRHPCLRDGETGMEEMIKKRIHLRRHQHRLPRREPGPWEPSLMEFSSLSTETGIITVEGSAWHIPAVGLGASCWPTGFTFSNEFSLLIWSLLREASVGLCGVREVRLFHLDLSTVSETATWLFN